MIFKDESGKVAQKFRARDARCSQKPASSAAPAASSEESIPDQNDCVEVVRSDATILPVLTLAPTIEERAMAFFLNNYIMTADSPAIGHMAMIYRMAGSLPECLISSIKAVGLAGYGHAIRAPPLFKRARYQYVQALRATNEALRSPTQATKDSTLIAILILSLYEAVTGTNQKSLKAWSDHISGASALLKLRGREQICTTEGRQLFIQTISSLMITSIQQDIPLPDYIIEWTREARKLMPPHPGHISQEIMMEYTAYNASIVKGTLSDPDAIIARGLELDSILAASFENPAEEWDYETVYTEAEPDLIYNGRYHIYFDTWVSQIWNGMRSFRCLLHEQVRKTIQQGHFDHPPRLTDPSYTAQLQQSVDVMCSLQADILATVPQHVGYVSRHQRYPKPPSPTGPWKPGREPAILSSSMTGPYFLLWPLWYAGMMTVSTDATRRYVVRNLKMVSDELGIQQARVLSDILEKQCDLSFR